MKILYVIPDIVGSRGGIQRYSFDVIEALSEDHYITYVSKCSQKGEVSHFRPEHIREVHLGGVHWCQNVLFVFNILWQLLFIRPDVCFIGHIHYLPFVSFLCRLMNVPYIVFTYGVESWSFLGDTYKKGFLSAKKVISISQFTASRLSEIYSISQADIQVLPCVSSPERFYPEALDSNLHQSMGIPDEAMILLSVGRMDSRETFHPYDVVLSVLSDLRERIGEVHYVHVGVGSDFARMQDVSRDIAYAHFVGFVSDEDLPAYYSLADVFLSPGKLEGFGIVFLEALLSGTPVITGKYDGSAEIVSQVPFGMSVDPDSKEDVFGAVISVLEQKRAGQYDVQQMRKKVLEVFGPEMFKRHFDSLFHELFPTSITGV